MSDEKKTNGTSNLLLTDITGLRSPEFTLDAVVATVVHIAQ
jgi:hypothetical protein